MTLGSCGVAEVAVVPVVPVNGGPDSKAIPEDLVLHLSPVDWGSSTSRGITSGTSTEIAPGDGSIPKNVQKNLRLPSEIVNGTLQPKKQMPIRQV